MKIRLMEMDIAWGHVDENIAMAERLMEKSDEADLYALPEMWATGFAIEPEGMAEDEDHSAALAWMRSTATQRHCAISGSLAIRTADDGRYRNRHYFVTPEAISFYDKHHLFTPGGEHEHYTAGQKTVIAEWLGVRFLLQTCYDLRFPLFSRWGLAGEYDAIIYAANWPSRRQLAWDTLVRARAIENQCYVVAVNRTGSDPATEYSGGSSLIDPTGLTTEEIDLERLQRMRNRFRVLDDRDHLPNQSYRP